MVLLSATAGIVEFGRLIVINKKSKGLHDKMRGAAAFYVNNLIELLGINITLVKATSIGSCEAVNMSCTGIRGLLQTGKADFSLTSLEITDLDPGNCFPHDYGPMYQVSRTYTSQFADQPAGSMTAGVFQLLLDVSPLILLILFALYFAAFLLLNIRIRRTGITIFRHYSLIHVWQHVMMHPQKNFKSFHRRMILGKLQ